MFRENSNLQDDTPSLMQAQLAAALAGRYDIERELGRGGMAVVYLARDVKHQREVAVKVLLPDLGNSLGVERFLREIATAARLTHPNILPLHDSGEAEGLIYYVMPYVRGESLRQRITRERQLPIDDAIAIAKQVASALDYAHEQGVVHRDIKPENILIGGGGQAIVADFGLARALYSASSTPLTHSGLAVGTPMYMSPEQASAERAVDPRTDIYSLGCVVFEMISGLPPFRGATVHVLIAHHVSTPPPSLCIDRASCPPAVDMAVRRALAKTPADRFRTAGEFVRAMDAPSGSSAPATSAPVKSVRRRPWMRVLGGVVGTAAVAGIAAAVTALVSDAYAPALDPAKVVVVPFLAETSADSVAAAAFRRQLIAALSEWDGVHLVEESRVREAVADRDRDGWLRSDEAVDVARGLGAGRMIRGTVVRIGDSVVVVSSAFDGIGESRTSRVPYLAGSALTTDQVRIVANNMLRDGDELPWTAGAPNHRPKLGAWLAYDAGRAALDAWNLGEAEVRFREAVGIDPGHARAQLLLAQTLTWEWNLQEIADRRHAALQAVNLREHLSDTDAEVATGLLALAEWRFPDACSAFRRVVATDRRHFPAWYGLGDCQERDPLIVEDARSPSRFAFRGSAHAGVKAYVQALDVLPAAPPDFAYLRLSAALRTQTNRFRPGYRVVGDTIRYAGRPTLLADTLAYVPYPLATLVSAPSDASARGHLRALERNRQTLRDLFETWVRTSPKNPQAREMLAQLLEAAGDIAAGPADQPSALSATRIARSLTTDTLRKLDLATSEVRLLLKNEEFTSAARLADSLLAANPTPTQHAANLLLGLAALTGRIDRTAQLLRELSTTTQAPDSGNGLYMSVPPQVTQRLAGSRASAMLGACSDSVQTLREWMPRTLTSHYAADAERERIANALLWRPLSHATPCIGVAAVTGVRANDRLLLLQQTFATKGSTGLRVAFDSLQAARRGLRPGDVAIDYTYHEAWLLAQAGDTARASAHLDRSLTALPTLTTLLLRNPAQAAGLVRAMMLRASLAERQRDAATARRWARAVVALWGNADPALQDDVGRMRKLAEAT